jgi:hypothetical protein
MTGYAWTTSEDRILKDWYPKIGLPGAVVKIQLAGYERSNDAVRARASILKLLSPYCTANTSPNKPAAHYSWNPKWDGPYSKAHDLISQGTKVAIACRMAGIERSMFYRMRKMKEGK